MRALLIDCSAVTIVVPFSSYESQSGAVQSTGCTHFLELNGFKTTENRQHLQVRITLCVLHAHLMC